MNLVKNKLAREGVTIRSSGYDDMKEVAASFFLSQYLINKSRLFWLASYHPRLICLKLEQRNQYNIEVYATV